MLTFRHALSFGFATALAAAGVLAAPSALSLDDQLTLEMHPVASTTAVNPTLPANLADGLRPTTDENLLGLAAPRRPTSVTDIKGVDYADLKNDVRALAYRTERGVGLGLATTGGVAITGGYATEGGARINLYYVQSLSELNDASRATGLDLSTNPSSSVGITIGWKF